MSVQKNELSVVMKTTDAYQTKQASKSEEAFCNE